jgi:hypothetical protein
MRSNQLKKRLVDLVTEGMELEVIKDTGLSKIRGGNCPNLQTCGNYNNTCEKYKVGDKELTIDADINMGR